MRLERSKNAIRNAGYGIINKVVLIIMPFIIRTVFIRTLGIEFLGLNSLFSSVLTVLNLTELGFSSAIVFSMYKPIAQDDRATINALLLYYRRVYRIIGLIVLIIGLVLIPLLPRLINGTYPDTINLTWVYLVFLLNTVISYFLFAYLGSLITAHQRDDIISRINLVISLLMYTIQAVILIFVRNYYVYIFIMPLFTIINNIRTAIVAKKLFPQYRPFGKLDQETKRIIKEKVSGLIISKLCNTTRNSLDSIFISFYLGLVETAIYNNYYYIMNAVSSLVIVFTGAATAGVGNSVAMESEEKNYHDMNRMNFLFMWLCGWCTVCLLCLYQPFMAIWTGEYYMFPISTVILLCSYFFLLRRGDIISIYTAANGLWWQLRFRTILETVTNISLNWILGKFFGVNGIIWATIISVFLFAFLMGSPLVFKNAFPHFHVWGYFFSVFLYACVTAAVCAITFVVCALISIIGIWGLAVKAVICLVLPNLLYFLAYFKTKRFKDSMRWLAPRIKASFFKRTTGE